jgi:hypothetical protein
MTRRVLSYSIGDFLHDLKREFAFLEERGYQEDSSEWQSHEGASPPGTLFGESVFSACPIVRYRGPGARVIVAHDPRGEVQLSLQRADGSSLDIQELIARKDARAAQRYGGGYNATSETAGAVLARLAQGLATTAMTRSRLPRPSSGCITNAEADGLSSEARFARILFDSPAS